MHIGDDVRRFVLGNIVSVPQLEALLLLRASGEGQPWTTERVADRLYLPAVEVAPLLEQLAERGLIEARASETTTWTYRPATPELDALCARLESVYARNLVDISRLIHSRTDRSAQRFADAFKWRKD
jgi:hypothetical protein